MKSIKIDSVLLFALVIPFIMTYRIGPSDTPYWLFGLIFLGLFSYLILDILNLKEKTYFLFKNILLWVLIFGVIGSAIYSAIVVRYKTHPAYMIHDIIIQQESAVYFLLHRKNPYSATYFDTPLAVWHYSDKDVNPALYHFVMEPFYLIFAIPFYAASNRLFGFFDARMPLFFLFFATLFLAGKLVKDRSKKLLFIILLAFNPAMLGYTLEGRSDIFMFGFLFMGLFLLHKKRYFIAGIPIALAFAVKQSAWPLMPFYIVFLYFKTQHPRGVASPRQTWLSQHLGGGEATTLTPPRWIPRMVPFVLTFSIIVLPFFFWDAKAFLDSTVFYLSGNILNGYPISGYGLGMLLYQLGIIKDVHQYYPFAVWQIIIGVPLVIVLLIYLKRSPTVARLILVYGIFLFVFWYLSRYFNNSHLGYLSVVFITAYFWPNDKTT